jgi:hypothetical protein
MITGGGGASVATAAGSSVGISTGISGLAAVHCGQASAAQSIGVASTVIMMMASFAPRYLILMTGCLVSRKWPED